MSRRGRGSRGSAASTNGDDHNQPLRGPAAPREVRQAFLQMMLSRKVLARADAETLLAKLCKDLGGPDGCDVRQCMADINKDLAPLHLNIRGVRVGDSEVYGIVNLVSDDIAKAHASKIKEWEKTFFKDVIKILCENKDGGVDKMELLATKIAQGGTSASQKEKDTTLFLLEVEHWLRKDKHNRFYLGPRTFMELGEFVASNEMDAPQLLYF